LTVYAIFYAMPVGCMEHKHRCVGTNAVLAIIKTPAQNKKKQKKALNAWRRFEYSSDQGEQYMNKVQLPECGLFRKSAVLLASFLAIVFNVSAQVRSPALVAAGVPDAEGYHLPGDGASAGLDRVSCSNS